MRTSGDADVALNLSNGLLFLPSTRAYGRHFFIIEDGYTFPENQTFDVLFQSLECNTTVTQCPVWQEKAILDTGVEQIPHEILGVRNCSLMKIPQSGGFVLHNISLLRGIEITSDKPVCLLSGFGTYLTTINANGVLRPNSSGRRTPITWNINPPLERWANQFVVIWRPDKREINLSIFCKYAVMFKSPDCSTKL